MILLCAKKQGEYMKYSIILPYYKRPDYLHNTLVSFEYHYHRKDYEVIVVEDHKNNKDIIHHATLIGILQKFNTRGMICGIAVSPLEGMWNPAPLFNIGVASCRGDILIISNPECIHEVDILSGLDYEFGRDPNCYVICGCEEVVPQEGSIRRLFSFKDFKFKHRIWFQHSKFNNRGFHFCSAISKEKYNEIGGFDNTFAFGVGYDDNDFRDNVIYNNIPIILRDDLLVAHVRHGEDIIIPDRGTLTALNGEYYYEKLKNRGIELEFAQ